MKLSLPPCGAVMLVTWRKKMYTLTFNFRNSGSNAVYCDTTVTGKTCAAAYDAAYGLTSDEGHDEMVVIELVAPSGETLIERMV
jgi:hypothetical protein